MQGCSTDWRPRRNEGAQAVKVSWGINYDRLMSHSHHVLCLQCWVPTWWHALEDLSAERGQQTSQRSSCYREQRTAKALAQKPLQQCMIMGLE
jgi:hypothetical protein